MPQIETTIFQKFKLSPDEEKVASVMAPINLIYLHNLRSDLAFEILNLEPNPADMDFYWQRHAFLSGGLAKLTQLIGD